MGQEVFRRLHNTKIEIHGNEIVDIMNKFMMNLKISGYNSFDRYQILQSGFNCYEKLRSKVDNGSRPFYRNRHFEKRKRKYEKLEKKTSWFTKKASAPSPSPFSSVFFVPSTPEAEYLELFSRIQTFLTG